MTTDLSKFKVANAFKHLEVDHGLMDDVASGFNSIRYRGKAWSLLYAGKAWPFRRDDDGTPLSYIDMIILGISPGMSKVYFGKQEEWSEDSAGAPICASLKGDVPDPGVPIPQSKSCGTCSHNDWITKPGGGRGKECQDHKRMAILLMPAMTQKMLGQPLIEPVYLKIPPGSFKSLKVFCEELTHSGIPLAAVVTRVSFSADKLFQMDFKVVQALADAEASTVLPLMEDPQTKQIIGQRASLREIAPPQERPAETGLLSAFGKAPADKPAARTNGSPPEDVEEVKAAPKRAGRPKKVVEESAVEPAMPDKPESYEDSDPDLDDTVAKLLSNKMSNMLK